jgi:hypothetical protein
MMSNYVIAVYVISNPGTYIVRIRFTFQKPGVIELLPRAYKAKVLIFEHMCCKRRMKWFVGSYSCVKALNLRFTCQNIVRGDFMPLLCVKRREDIFLLRLKEHLFWFRTSQSIGQQTHKALYITQMNLHYSLQTVHHFFIQNLFSNIVTNIQYNFVYHLVHNINKD